MKAKNNIKVGALVRIIPKHITSMPLKIISDFYYCVNSYEMELITTGAIGLVLKPSGRCYYEVLVGARKFRILEDELEMVLNNE